MRIRSFDSLVLTLLFFGSASRAAEEAQWLIEIEIFRVSADISGSTSLTDAVWGELRGANPLAGDYPFRVFTVADQKIGGVRFQTGEKGWTWDEKKDPPAGRGVEKVAAPKIKVLDGQRFELRISSEQPIAYLEKRPDGLLELKTAKENPGLSLGGTVRTMGEERVVLEDLSFVSRFVEKRKPIEGVPLDVGEPVFVVRDTKTTLSLAHGRDYGLDIRINDGRGLLRCRLRVSAAK